MPIFTMIGAAAFGAGTFLAGATAFALSAATSIGLSYVSRALSGQQDTPTAAKADGFSVQTTLQTGGEVPRSFNVGYSVTAGSLVYGNTWGNDGETPNAYITQVIALQDMPGSQFLRPWISGELCDLDNGTVTEMGNPVLQYRKDGKDHLWIKYYDGSQTVADNFLVTKVASVDRPWGTNRVGFGVAYAILTALVDDTLYTGVPALKAEMSGIPLYDPSKDSTVGGAGSHRWSDRSTWGGDGDNLPAVQIYNVLRGITYNGAWLYGMQQMTAARLPLTNWIGQINKCRDTIAGADGLEPVYRSGGQISVNAQIANTIEAILTTCQGRISEIGGFYKIRLGEPDSPTFFWTDADLLSTEQQMYKPFFALSDSVNGIMASYPYPAEGWNMKVAPPYLRTDLEFWDGGRRLLASPTFDFVPYTGQVQRLQQSAIREAQRARTHVFALPPQYWIVEPGDIGAYTSARNGYVSKLFRCDAGTDKANLDVILHVTEVDPADYDWNQGTDYTQVPTAPTVFPRPAPQGILDWYVEAAIIKDPDGFERRPGIRIGWDGSMPGVIALTYQARMFDSQISDYVTVVNGVTPPGSFSVGAMLVQQSLLPNTIYQVRVQYVPSAPRDMIWSDWRSVTTPNVSLSIKDFNEALENHVTNIFANGLSDQKKAIDEIATLVQQIAARTSIDKKEVRTQLVAQIGSARASIEEVRTVAVGVDNALAQFEIDVSAQFGDVEADVNEVRLAAASITDALASLTSSVSAQFGTVYSNITVNSTAIATLQGYAASKYSVTLDVNGYATGFTLINAGGGVSSTTFLTTNFQIAAVGPGGGQVPIFQTAFVGGVPKIALRADVYADGSITAGKMSVATLSAITANMGTITAGVIQGPTGRMIIDLANERATWSD